MNFKLPLTVALISLNEEENLERTLNAVKDIASEIVIIDSYSTDKTAEIAQKFGAEFIQEKWLGYSMQKNLLIEKCNYDWILFLDCDEEISTELKESLKKVVNFNMNNSNCILGYYINRKTIYLGKKLDYAWHPDWVLRLVNKNSKPYWKDAKVHEHLIIQGNTEKLNGYIFHYSYSSIEDHFLRTVKYAKLSAEDYFLKKKKFSYWKLFFNPLYSFIKQIFFKRAILDGAPGLIAAVSAYIYTFLKYAFLWNLEKRNFKK